MSELRLSVFVDESGKFQFPDPASRFYIVGMVFHDQAFDASELIERLEMDWRNMGFENFCFHAGPLIRREKGYQYMPREQRTAIFSRMMLFARKMKFLYHCLVVDKKYVTSTRQIVERLQIQLAEFLDADSLHVSDFSSVKIYYDCGQTPVTKLLHDTFSARLGDKATFAPAVKPESYTLFQLADLICTIKLIELKLTHKLQMTAGENRFFRGPRIFKHDILRSLKTKEI